MSVDAHLEELKKRHTELSEMVEHEQRAPGSNDLHVLDLKKQKLRLKEEIERLSH